MLKILACDVSTRFRLMTLEGYFTSYGAQLNDSIIPEGQITHHHLIY